MTVTAAWMFVAGLHVGGLLVLWLESGRRRAFRAAAEAERQFARKVWTAQEPLRRVADAGVAIAQQQYETLDDLRSWTAKGRAVDSHQYRKMVRREWERATERNDHLTVTVSKTWDELGYNPLEGPPDDRT